MRLNGNGLAWKFHYTAIKRTALGLPEYGVLKSLPKLEMISLSSNSKFISQLSQGSDSRWAFGRTSKLCNRPVTSAVSQMKVNSRLGMMSAFLEDSRSSGSTTFHFDPFGGRSSRAAAQRIRCSILHGRAGARPSEKGSKLNESLH